MSQTCSVGPKSVGRAGQPTPSVPSSPVKLLTHSSHIRSVIVLQKKESRAHCTRTWSTNGSEDLISVPDSSQGTSVSVTWPGCEPVLVQVWTRTMANGAPMLNLKIPVLWLLHRLLAKVFMEDHVTEEWSMMAILPQLLLLILHTQRVEVHIS